MPDARLCTDCARAKPRAVQQVYAGPLSGGGRAVVLFNRHSSGTQYPISNITVNWAMLGYKPGTEAAVRDLFSRQDLGTFRAKLTLPVDIHDARMVRIEPLEAHERDEAWRAWDISKAPGQKKSAWKQPGQNGQQLQAM